MLTASSRPLRRFIPLIGSPLTLPSPPGGERGREVTPHGRANCQRPPAAVVHTLDQIPLTLPSPPGGERVREVRTHVGHQRPAALSLGLFQLVPLRLDVGAKLR